MTFASEVKEFKKVAEENAAKIVAKRFEMTCTKIVDETPVVSGKLKNNWTATFTSAASGVDRKSEIDPTRLLFGGVNDVPAMDSRNSIKEVVSKIKPKEIGNPLFFTNCLDYADDVEGQKSSKNYQGPKGFLRRNVLVAGLRSIKL